MSEKKPLPYVASLIQIQVKSSRMYLKPNKVEELPDISELEFEAKSSKDGAW